MGDTRKSQARHGWTAAAKSLTAVMVGALPLIVVFMEVTGIDRDIAAGGSLLGILYGVLHVINSPVGHAYINRFMPWLLTEQQAQALETYQGKHEAPAED